uniref:Putative secreted protein n=1 Tax=Amblyomma triste TaxID=251400 RepID=A0A023G200_AMBTT
MNFALLFFVVIVMVNCYIGTGNTEETDKKNEWKKACRYTVNSSHHEYLVRRHHHVPFQYPCKSYLCTMKGQLVIFTWIPSKIVTERPGSIHKLKLEKRIYIMVHGAQCYMHTCMLITIKKLKFHKLIT